MNIFFSCISIVLLSASIFSCNNPSKDNQLTSQEKKDGWKLLFDGETTNGWHLYRLGDKPSVWEVRDGALFCNLANHQEDGDLVTNEEYENYDLKFEWKMGDDGNSGVFINVVENDTIPAAWFTGPEYQLLGIKHPDYAVDTKRSGCIFGFSSGNASASTKPAGEWNSSEIKQENGKVQFFLNGIKTAEADFTSPQWKEAVSQSKFAGFHEFGKRTKGKIGLQDWGKGVSFKNIKLREL